MYNRDILTILANALMLGNVIEPKLSLNVLDTVNDLLMIDDYYGYRNTPRSVIDDFERAKGLDGLEEIQKNPNYDVYTRTVEVLSKHFEVD